jgi:hypothetical protein
VQCVAGVSITGSIFVSLSKIVFLTYLGAPRIDLTIFVWHLSIIAMLDCFDDPHSWIPYVAVADTRRLATILYE